MNYVTNCANFISSTGTCQVCVSGYNLQNNACVQIPAQQAVSCPIGQQAVNGICQIVDPNCIYYSNSNQCQICAKGWQLNSNPNGLCTKIICGAQQYSGNGFCAEASPLCNTFDPINGNCLTCINGYLLLPDGNCYQTLGNSAAPTTPSDCHQGYYMLGSSCVPVSALCGNYNQSTGACTTCQDTVNYYLSNGVCYNISTFCANSPRTYFSNGQCVPVSSLCDQFNPATGACYSCQDNTQLNPSTGQCRYN
jgi:hypothetical protein